MPYAAPCSADTEEDFAQASLHRRIARVHRAWLVPSCAEDPPKADAADHVAALDFVRAECLTVTAEADAAPDTPEAFCDWFRGLAQTGPGQGDPLFPWLATSATRAEMLWFLRQELAGEAGFDDLVALALVGMPLRAKLEMGRNLWDELGRGHPAGVHASLLIDMARELGLMSAAGVPVWEAVALANLMAGLGVERRAYQTVGALGVIELTAPGRVSQVAAGLRRLGVTPVARRYFELHATLDVEHFRRWETEVLRPLVAAEPRIARHLAQGALMRLRAGQRCFARYHAILMTG